VDRLLIRTAAGQAGIGNNDGQIAGSAPTVTGRANPIRGHTVVTDTNLADPPTGLRDTHNPEDVTLLVEVGW
jgi:hypothetical protein